MEHQVKTLIFYAQTLMVAERAQEY
jgi:hypothetical protein